VQIEAFFHEVTNAVSYLVWDRDGGSAAVIDSVLDYDPRSQQASTASADAILAAAAARELTIEYALETHAHSDHLSAASYLRAATGAKVGIGDHVRLVQQLLREVVSTEGMKPDGGDFDVLFGDGDRFSAGSLEFEVMHTPGHTPACISYRTGDDVFVGDTIFMPDFGTARADFPGGDARTLFRSIGRLLALPPQTRLHLCHDYKSPIRDDYRWTTTVAEELAHNIHLSGGTTEDEFVTLRTRRDASLPPPRLMRPSIEANLRAGGLPPDVSRAATTAA
jgi:glyoxylase-like metal-dependent hydrolase (beta-lactamase superfamily II)